MYLKRIEMVGFKSFADRTKLDFEPGMTAIVGPNGCGKSNVSDAVRWVLGEQSPKALRGSNMVDVIFTGTDSRKSMGMAEVSLTLGDCDSALGTEYNEVTVTRRVVRSGEGQYFINKAPCRLKDIHRLFMDTGVGTNSYSMMEQGRIDQILSSRPDDRRAVFEEASGITKYKADKKEALRKLEHTEANLLRLADIIKEVKRQIISLQRQAGKARRYQSLHEDLRRLDLHATKQRLSALDETIRTLETQFASMSEQDEAVRHDLDQAEEAATACRADLTRMDEEMSEAMDASVRAKTERGAINELITSNRSRVEDLRALTLRESKGEEATLALLEEQRRGIETTRVEHDQAQQAQEAARKEYEQRADAHRISETRANELTELVDKLRTESVDLEQRMANLQNELRELDKQERGTEFRRERLTVEKATMERAVKDYADRRSAMLEQIAELQADVEQRQKFLDDVRDRQAREADAATELKDALAQLKSDLAAKKAQTQLLDTDDDQDGFPAGARWLLDAEGDLGAVQAEVLGSLAERITTEPPYQLALESALRAWLDAVVIKTDAGTRDLLRTLETAGKGAARMLTLCPDDNAPQVKDGPGECLLDHVSFDKAYEGLARRLLGSVRVVPSASDFPESLPEHTTYVSQEGSVLHASGAAEFWTRDGQDANPVSRRHMLISLQEDIAELERGIDYHTEALEARDTARSDLAQDIEHAATAVEKSKRNLALCEGENQLVVHEAKQAEERLDTVTWELNAIVEEDGSGQSRREEISQELDTLRNRQAEVRALVSTHTTEQRQVDQERAQLLSRATEQRIALGQCEQEVEQLARRLEHAEQRIEELERSSSERRRDMDGYRQKIETLQQAVEESAARLQPLEEQVAACQAKLDTLRTARQERTGKLSALERELHEKRAAMEQLRARKTSHEVRLAEERVRRQNIVERVTSEYRISYEQMQAEPCPEWSEEGEPDQDTLETRVAEIRARLESMGPVNLVAIDEHQELEERHAFMTKEEDDLLKAKQQLLDTIRQINKTTTEMFSETFNRVNENFQVTFKKLFGGGSSKLVLLDEEDVLDSGIEIIARPPGKKLQTVSLLSGGERTMTAVALLFALYMVKPSPFCILDELDAALDDANIGRFVNMLKDFVQGSQFIVVTHNRQTISAAHVLYGITMDGGVSNIMSVKFSDHVKEEVRTDSVAGHKADAAPA